MSIEYDFSNRRFLVVDDESFMLGLVERMLRQCKAGEVATASSAQAALDHLRNAIAPFDCLIADCNMPTANGLQLLQAVRAGRIPGASRGQPFILLTGHGDMSLVQTAIALDVSGYVVKPASFDKLTHTIEHAVAKPVAVREPAYYETVAVPRVGFAGDEHAAAADEPFAWVVMPPSMTGAAAARPAAKEPAARPSAAEAPEKALRFSNRRQCALADLREGMVLAEDVHGNQDALLLKRGTQLSRRLIERLRDGSVAVPGSVWIGDIID